MLKLAWRNLIHERTRLAISVGGVALAVLLILVIGGIFAGSEEHAVAYIKNQPVPLWLMQAGVENMHMASSILSPETLKRVRDIEGVKEAVGLLYANAGVDVAGNVVYSYIFAVSNEAPFGGPWNMAQGSTKLETDEVIIDHDLARKYSLGVGDIVNILGDDLTITGLSRGTFGIATSITFVNKTALASLLGIPPDSASYILIQPEAETDLGALSEQLRTNIPEANLLTKDEFIASDKEMIRQMGVDIIRAMTSSPTIVGLLVIGLTIYTATLEQAREYGVLKAIGANTIDLIRLVFAQAYTSTGMGFSLGIILSYGVASLVSNLIPEMLVLIELDTLLGHLPALALVTALATLIPIAHIAQTDPMVVFKV